MMVMMSMTVYSRLSNFWGSFMEDWMGRIRPMPSNVKMAEPMVRVKSRGLNIFTVSLMPSVARVDMS